MIRFTVVNSVISSTKQPWSLINIKVQFLDTRPTYESLFINGDDQSIYIYLILGIFKNYKLLEQMASLLKKFSHWAYNHEDNQHPKYNTVSHALTLTLKSTLIFVMCSLILRYYIFYNGNEISTTYTELQPYAFQIGVFLQLYLIVMIVSRFYQNGPIALYEAIWACNQCLLLAGIGCITGDSFLIRVILIVISVDQLLWYFLSDLRYIDIVGYAIKRKFYVGVAKYIIWPETSKMRLFTTFHHLWFLPLCLWLIHPSSKHKTFTIQIYILSCIYCLLLAILGRITTPKEIVLKNSESQQKTKVYMNLNLSWELWKDVKIGFLQQLYKIVPPKLIIFIVSLFWDIGNMPGFLLFWGLESLTK